ncbi:PREDICTED: phosphorylated adapter RNA export protein-like [Amphimedon queenslandica]|uniref:Phosphorylated adapter RNA export protein n=1 Tax=Amphimedon queenslandica TaxID=400682 RepID=A0A1X7V062_AMPQE|nr:PREDICTED: phosphorylated adapter RNA export protein-like [Amphimedon queenslandica]|eukprot:XP_011403582.1 PREDICTED: phosphorylated adapter RNA export protein-like [Amphimedon queenslandica]
MESGDRRKFPPALHCHKLSDISSSTSEDKAAAEIARCLKEPNYYVIHSTVKSLGVARAIELFNKTSKIQKQGGIATCDGDRKKSPGGVFLGLVKKEVTNKQKKLIFKRFRPKKKRSVTIKRNCNGVVSEDCGTNEELMETDQLPSSVSSGVKDRVKGDQFNDLETDLPDPGDYGITFC